MCVFFSFTELFDGTQTFLKMLCILKRFYSPKGTDVYFPSFKVNVLSVIDKEAFLALVVNRKFNHEKCRVVGNEDNGSLAYEIKHCFKWSW